ncbi:MAG TPA: DUF2283 domain-containing protein [Nanoarchaeota archaeon]|nr:DUF2283 domain-containing protein [Candidatus Pacearchaeota archaeon]HIH17972.1 DUF2283 domain-containing protein [Nanoarchaeota archaeon]HIH33840.1 DUF2283 domain-containing protein [Nanoarchaeota archaeon]HIH50783.1 DUF2283 domain-containing protein [Nanoarchaeota archaeon]HIH65819.1 DUF2283 domain-containing protein [Nanoarchaeota archaeon]
MSQTSTYNIYYDTEGDFLEISLGEPSVCYAEEPEEGVFIRKDEKTGEIKSIGILSFKKRTQILKKLLQETHINLPLEISV